MYKFIILFFKISFVWMCFLLLTFNLMKIIHGIDWKWLYVESPILIYVGLILLTVLCATISVHFRIRKLKKT